MTAILNKVAAKVFGTANERLLKRLWPTISEINALESEMMRLSDDELRARTAQFREQVENRITGAELTGGTAEEQSKALRAVIDEALDEILVEAFAVVREASRRATGMLHFDGKLLVGIEPAAVVQRGHYYAIVDEVDSILIDEARTPLIISGASEESTEKYYVANDCMVRLKTEQQKRIAEIKRSDGDLDLKQDPRLVYHV